MENLKNPDRRTFFKAAIVSGALLVGISMPLATRAEERLGIEPKAQPDFAPNAFITISKDGRVTVSVPQAEMGQGVLTSLPMIVADELDLDWSMVGFAQAPAGRAFVNPAMGMQGTGGSSSI